jgi:cellobiose phosphorylase
MYRLITESLLGIRLETNKLFINPCLPADWVSFNIHYRYRETTYHITVTQLLEGHIKQTIQLDGVVCQEKFIPLVDDHREHTAEVLIGSLQTKAI